MQYASGRLLSYLTSLVFKKASNCYVALSERQMPILCSYIDG